MPAFANRPPTPVFPMIGAWLAVVIGIGVTFAGVAALILVLTDPLTHR